MRINRKLKWMIYLSVYSILMIGCMTTSVKASENDNFWANIYNLDGYSANYIKEFPTIDNNKRMMFYTGSYATSTTSINLWATGQNANYQFIQGYYDLENNYSMNAGNSYGGIYDFNQFSSSASNSYEGTFNFDNAHSKLTPDYLDIDENSNIYENYEIPNHIAKRPVSLYSFDNLTEFNSYRFMYGKTYGFDVDYLDEINLFTGYEGLNMTDMFITAWNYPMSDYHDTTLSIQGNTYKENNEFNYWYQDSDGSLIGNARWYDFDMYLRVQDYETIYDNYVEINLNSLNRDMNYSLAKVYPNRIEVRENDVWYTDYYDFSVFTHLNFKFYWYQSYPIIYFYVKVNVDGVPLFSGNDYLQTYTRSGNYQIKGFEMKYYSGTSNFEMLELDAIGLPTWLSGGNYFDCDWSLYTDNHSVEFKPDFLDILYDLDDYVSDDISLFSQYDYIDQVGTAYNFGSNNHIINGHNKVLEFTRNSGSGWSQLGLLFDSYMTSGSLSFWFKTTSSYNTYFKFYDEYGTQMIALYAGNAIDFQYYDGHSGIGYEYSGITDLDYWHNIMLDFNIALDKYSLYYDGMYMGYLDFYDACSGGLRAIQIEDNSVDFNIYIDGITYSWNDDDDYSYEKSMLSSKQWDIQAVGKANQSFINENNDFSFSYFNNRFIDVGKDYGSYLDIDVPRYAKGQAILTPLTPILENNNGFISFWFKSNTDDETLRIQFLDDFSNLYTLYIGYNNLNQFAYLDGTGIHTFGTYTVGVWNLISLYFRPNSDNFDVYLNDVKIGNTLLSLGNPVDINYMRIYIFETSDSDFEMKLRAIDYSWSSEKQSSFITTAHKGNTHLCDWEYNQLTDLYYFLGSDSDNINSIYYEYLNRYGLLEFIDSSSSNGLISGLGLEYENSTEQGIFSTWMYITSSVNDVYFRAGNNMYFSESSIIPIMFYLRGTDKHIYVLNSVGSWVDSGSFEQDKWIYIECAFNTTSETYNLKIDQTVISNCNFRITSEPHSTINFFEFYTSNAITLYIDEISKEGMSESSGIVYDNNIWFKAFFGTDGIDYSQFVIDLFIYNDTIECQTSISDYITNIDIYEYNNNFTSLEFGIHAYITEQKEVNYKIEVYIDDIENPVIFREYNNLYDADTSVLESITIMSYHHSALGKTFQDLVGLRSMFDNETYYDDYVPFPKFMEYFKFKVPPPPPDNRPYWSYWTSQIDFETYETLVATAEMDDGTEVDFSFDFALATVDLVEARFYYYTLETTSLGDWGLFNPLRDGIVILINYLIFIPAQFIIYFLILAFNYIFMYIIVGGLLILVWNILLKYLLWAGLWLLVGLYLLVFYVLPPVIEWIFTTLFPIIIDIFALVLSVIFALLIFIFTFGLIPYDDIYDVVEAFINEVADFIYTFIMTIIEALPQVFLYTFAYIFCVYLIYLRYYYCKARGFKNRSENLYTSYESYIKPAQVVGGYLRNFLSALKFW